MADETTETVETPPGAEVMPSGGIVTRADGSSTPIAPVDWRASLPPELQAEPTLAKYKSMEEALKGTIHAQRLVGKRLDYPGADAKPEAVAEFRKNAGVPETPDKYGVTLPKAPDGQEWDQGQVSAFLGQMHKAHARPEVVQAGLDFFVQYMAQQSDKSRASEAQESQAERAAAVKQLEAMWGPRGGPLWKHHESRALMAIETLMGDAPAEAVQRVKESANEPEVAHAFSLLAESLIEKGFLGEAEQSTAGASMEDAQRQVDALQKAWREDPRHILGDQSHPNHPEAWRQYEALLVRAAGPRGREIVAEARR